MKHSILLPFIVFSVLLMTLTSGCIEQTLFDETSFVEEDYEMEYSIEVTDPPIDLDVALKTDGAPVDLLVLDESNFKIFSDGFASGKPVSFHTIGLNPFIIETTETYELTKKGIYYVVIENSDYLNNGADAGRGVRYHIEVCYY